MSLHPEDEGFIFILSKNIVLVNDLAIRRDLLEKLPIPLGLALGGRWVWMNRWARQLLRWTDPRGHSALRALASEPHTFLTAYHQSIPLNPDSMLDIESSPLQNLEGDVVGQLAWSGDVLAGLAADQLETAVFLALDGRIVWSNLSAKRTLGLERDMLWENIYGFPPWEDVFSGVNVRRYGEYRMRFLTVGDYILGEALRLEIPDQNSVMPMEQVASLVHEIRNPLAALSGYVEMAQMDSGSETSAYYRHMMQEIDRLARLTSDLMAISRPLTVSPQEVLLEELVERAWFAAERGKVSGKQTIRLVKHYDPQQTFWADPDRMQQVVTNLIKNAVEAMRKTGSQLVVRFREARENVALAVEDDGPGLPADILRQLFVSRVTTKNLGNGLGLMIVRRIIEAHGGAVRVASSEGTTRIEMILPKKS